MVATGVGTWAPPTFRDAIFGMSPELRDAFLKGLSPEGLAKYVETGRIATQEAARRESADRVQSTIGEEAMKKGLSDPDVVAHGGPDVNIAAANAQFRRYRDVLFRRLDDVHGHDGLQNRHPHQHHHLYPELHGRGWHRLGKYYCFD